MIYEQLLDECVKSNVEVYDMDLINKGLYSDGVIAISNRLHTSIEKACVLAEELGHYETSSGDILDQTKIENRKQEKRARNWAYEKLVPLTSLICSLNYGCSNKFELSEYLDVTEEFLEEGIKHYKEKHGLYYTFDNFTICFEPLWVLENKNSR